MGDHGTKDVSGNKSAVASREGDLAYLAFVQRFYLLFVASCLQPPPTMLWLNALVHRPKWEVSVEYKGEEETCVMCLVVGWMRHMLSCSCLSFLVCSLSL